MLNIEQLERTDGQGQYLWDQWLWLLAGGAIVLIAAAVLLFSQLTPPPNGDDHIPPSHGPVH